MVTKIRIHRLTPRNTKLSTSLLTHALSSLNKNSLRDMDMSASFRSDDRVAEREGTRSFAIARNRRFVYQIMPTDLSLFELGILFNIIHHKAPNYSLFNYQNFWLVSVYCRIPMGQSTEQTRAGPPNPQQISAAAGHVEKHANHRSES